MFSYFYTVQRCFWHHFEHAYNKAFKSDSPRLAFLVWVWFSDYGIKIEFCGRVAHTLMRRYA